VTLADETGWKLSTTRAAARVASLLRAAGHRAGTDDLLDFLKSLPGTAPRGPRAHCIDALEAVLRNHSWTDVTQVDRARLPLAAQSAWDLWLQAVEPLRELRRASLAQWLLRLTEALRRCELLDALMADSAGLQVLAALRCTPPGRGGSASDSILVTVAASTQFAASAFMAWVDDVLEQAIFLPPVEATAQVVILPLARARLRPFSAVVCPGADAAHLGAGSPPEPLLGDALAVALGLDGVAARQQAERKAFAQLARASRLTLLYRRAEAAEPMTASPLLLRGQLAAARRGLPWAAAPDEREHRSVAPRPTPRPRPSAPALLPERYSASRYEHLRACPYRFYALAMLRLDDPQELDDELEKREVGSWLHAVMQRFHDERASGCSPEADLVALHGVAADEILRRFGGGTATADFLPFEAWFEGVAPAYVAWLHAVEAEGWSVQASELELRAVIAVGDGTTSIHGRLDRVDRRPVGAGSNAEPGEHRRLIDYKLKSKAAMQAQVRLPLEDTQLAFYAALLASAEGWPRGGIEAGYLALDGRDSVTWVPHAEVADSAQALLEGLAHDVSRLHDGTPLPALGDGAACEHCAARGLCRRDHWGPA
jgi:ATP-dependent helicase/nuclease subunit B